MTPKLGSQQFFREALVWQHLRHPFILPFIGIDRETFPGFLCLASPWMEHGTVVKHLKDHGRVNVDKLVSISHSLMLQLIQFSALSFLK